MVLSKNLEGKWKRKSIGLHRLENRIIISSNRINHTTEPICANFLCFIYCLHYTVGDGCIYMHSSPL